MHLRSFPAVALLGPRQVGKTTLASAVEEIIPSIYLDLESPEDRSKLNDPLSYLRSHEDKLVILDEVQRMPEIFQVLRGLIDEGRKRQLKATRFLLLGSASIDLLKQSGETLAGRISYLELSGLNLKECGETEKNKLWVRGGFPDSYLASDDQVSVIWRENFIKTYLERDIPQLGPRIPAETLRRFWVMLAHNQGSLLNAAQLARNLAVDGKTIARYLDLMIDLLLVRRLQPWHSNAGKRLVRSPKVYVRDSGLTHALLRISNLDNLLGHPVVGASWEGFVIENLLSCIPQNSEALFYRTSSGAEIDLLLRLPGGQTWAIEIKRGLSPKVEKGFHIACEDLDVTKKFVIYAGEERYSYSNDIEVIGLYELMDEIMR